MTATNLPTCLDIAGCDVEVSSLRPWLHTCVERASSLCPILTTKVIPGTKLTGRVLSSAMEDTSYPSAASSHWLLDRRPTPELVPCVSRECLSFMKGVAPLHAVEVDVDPRFFP